MNSGIQRDWRIPVSLALSIIASVLAVWCFVRCTLCDDTLVGHAGRGLTNETVATIAAADSAAPKKATDETPSTSPFGGPYVCRAVDEKVLDFGLYAAYQFRTSNVRILELADVAELNWNLLQSSVRSNLADPYGDVLQRYNYVIDMSGEIKVAVWSPTHFGGIVDTSFRKPDGTENAAKIQTDQNGKMINFYPELPFANMANQERYSPFWMTLPFKEGFKKFGVLDAASKHFRLAQSAPPPVTFNAISWTRASVLYAGEVIVVVDPALREAIHYKRLGNKDPPLSRKPAPTDYDYLINSDSGTYRPKAEFLDRVARYFERKLGRGPFAVESINGEIIREY